MTQDSDQGNVNELNRELKECLQAGEYLDALDICEEIEEAGGMNVSHWLAMAQCLVELRRKTDAKQAWLKALELDENQNEAIEALNKHFPGWRNEVARTAREASAKPATQVRRRQAAPPAPAARPAESRPASAPAGARTPEPAAPAPSPIRAPDAQPSYVPSDDALVNWTYVLEDVADAEVDRAAR